MANDPLRTYSTPTVIVPALKIGTFAGGSAGTFAVAREASSDSIQLEDRIIGVLSFATYVDALSDQSGSLAVPIMGLGDAFSVSRSNSSVSVVGTGVVGLDYSTASYQNFVFYIDSTATALP